MRVASFATRAGASRRGRPTVRGRSFRIVAAATAVASMVWVGEPAHASVLTKHATPSTTVPPAAKAQLLVDVATGRVLSEKNEHVPLRPASLTKLLTAMIAYDWLPPSTVIPVSAQAATAYPDRVGMKARQRWPLSIALRTLLVFSANDAAYALAQRVGGSLAGFAVIMRQAAAQLGMSGSPVLRDPAGLDGSEGFEGGNLMSAWDVAIMARDLMANRALASIVALKHYRFTGPDRIVYDLDNKNLYFISSYPGAIGIKTGFTGAAGFCVAEEAVRGGRTMLAVVMNGVNSYQTAADLLSRGFAVPVSAEQKDPLLPPIRQPEPASLLPRSRPATPGVTEARVMPDLAGAGAVAARPSGSSPVPNIVGVLVAGALVLLTVRMIIRIRRNRRRPAVSDSHQP